MHQIRRLRRRYRYPPHIPLTQALLLCSLQLLVRPARLRLKKALKHPVR